MGAREVSDSLQTYTTTHTKDAVSGSPAIVPQGRGPGISKPSGHCKSAESWLQYYSNASVFSSTPWNTVKSIFQEVPLWADAGLLLGERQLCLQVFRCWVVFLAEWTPFQLYGNTLCICGYQSTFSGNPEGYSLSIRNCLVCIHPCSVHMARYGQLNLLSRLIVPQVNRALNLVLIDNSQ